MIKKTAKRVFDTDTATLVKKVTSGAWGDPKGYEEVLYLTPEGDYFLYSNGGADSIHPLAEIKFMNKPKAQQFIDEN